MQVEESPYQRVIIHYSESRDPSKAIRPMLLLITTATNNTGVIKCLEKGAAMTVGWRFLVGGQCLMMGNMLTKVNILL